VLALDILMLIEKKHQQQMVQNLKDYWLAYSNPKAFKAAKQAEQRQKEDEATVEMSPEDIDAIVAKLSR